MNSFTFIMKKLLLTLLLFLIVIFTLNAQIPDEVIVPAGIRVAACFPPARRYLYPDFTQGEVNLNNGNHNNARLNYNFLFGEMEFIRNSDTLTITNKKEIHSIIIGIDTFLLENGYIRLISNGPVRVGLKQNISLKDILRKGAMGTINRTSTVDTYNTVPVDGRIYDMVPNEDWVFRKTEEYFFSVPSGEFLPFSRRNVLKIFPGQKKNIEEFLRSEKISFDSREDLLKLAFYLGRN